MLYNTGTIAINGNTATGTGTNWTAPASQVRAGQTIMVMSNPVQLFQITSINSATSLTVTPAASPALSGQKYGILVTDALSVDGLAQSISQLINEYDENIGGWETFATTSANQNITVTINGKAVTIPAIGKLLQKGSGGGLAIGDGGTGATTADGARTNLGLGSSATRNAYSNSGDMLSVGDFGLGSTTGNSYNDFTATQTIFSNSGGPVAANFLGFTIKAAAGDYALQLSGRSGQNFYWRGRDPGSTSSWRRIWDDGNTTVDTNGYIKRASPVVKLYANGSYETNDESEGVIVTRLSEGQYLIDGCMGMNSDAAWGGIDGGFDIPKDRNGQALIWLDYEVNADGAVVVKTYHRTHPEAPAFARNEVDGVSNGDPIDIPRDQFVSVRVEMPQNSIWNKRIAEASQEQKVNTDRHQS
ncbi:phage tail protein [Leclercia sp. UBA1284]|uniref:phage tail fiber protein n=1 Tax=Leclercia sp. UBA1284 TaxID=1946737 RepID=UPI00257D8650|nr:phage tail protein [Leclercia sp. UBA1284]